MAISKIKAVFQRDIKDVWDVVIMPPHSQLHISSRSSVGNLIWKTAI